MKKKFYGSDFVIWLYLQKAMYRACDLDHWHMKVFFQWIEYNPISILYTFQIDISSNSREIKYQDIGRTHRHRDSHTRTHTQTDRQTGWKQYLATPSGGEVFISPNSFPEFALFQHLNIPTPIKRYSGSPIFRHLHYFVMIAVSE